MLATEHKKRIISAVIGVSVLLALYYYLGHTAVVLASFVIAMGVYYEFLDLTLDKRFERAVQWQKLGSALVVGAAVFGLMLIKPQWSFLPLYFSFFVFVALTLFFGHFNRGRTVEQEHEQIHWHLHDTMAQSFGLIYSVGFLCFVPLVHALPHGPECIVLLLALVWGDDIGAYYGGKKFGRHKLSQQLSPKKTMEGSIAGVIACMGIATLAHYYLLPEIALPRLLVVALIISLVAQLGDLFESLVKRAVNAKDSGFLLPGHGGLFDRFDSLILAAPFYYFLMSKLV